MIHWWWLILAFWVGLVAGIAVLSLCMAAKED